MRRKFNIIIIHIYNFISFYPICLFSGQTSFLVCFCVNRKNMWHLQSKENCSYP